MAVSKIQVNPVKAITISGTASFDSGQVAYGDSVSHATGGVVTNDNIAGILLNGVGFVAMGAISSDKSSFNVWSPSTLSGNYNYSGVIYYK